MHSQREEHADRLTVLESCVHSLHEEKLSVDSDGGEAAHQKVVESNERMQKQVEIIKHAEKEQVVADMT